MSFLCLEEKGTTKQQKKCYVVSVLLKRDLCYQRITTLDTLL